MSLKWNAHDARQSGIRKEHWHRKWTIHVNPPTIENIYNWCLCNLQLLTAVFWFGRTFKKSNCIQYWLALFLISVAKCQWYILVLCRCINIYIALFNVVMSYVLTIQLCNAFWFDDWQWTPILVIKKRKID